MLYGQPKYQAPSDREDASTDVSSRSQMRRNQPVSNSVQYNQHGIYVSHTPQASLGKASDLQNYLPDIRGSQSSNYDPYEPSGYRLGYRKQMESAGVSRALGIAAPRYEGVGNALRMARELSKENIALSSNH